MRSLRKRKEGKKQANQMPAVGMRRSTRVFVPKSASKVAAVEVGDADVAAVAATVVLRSGKRLVVSKPSGKKVEADDCKGEWMQLFGWQREEVGCGGDGLKKGDGVRPEGRGKWREDEMPMSVVGTDEGRKVASGKKFGIVYNRKRRTFASDDVAEKHNVKDRRFGLSFTRRKQRKTNEVDTAVSKVPSLAGKVVWITMSSIGGHQIPDSTRSFAVNVGFRYRDLWDGVGESGVLLVLVNVSDPRNLNHFECFLVSTLSGMRRKRVNLLNLSSFLLSNSIANVFSNHGVHFLPLKWDSYISCRNATSGAGLFGIVGTQILIPLLSVGFSALPFYFKGLHLSMLLSFRCCALDGHLAFKGRPVDFSAVVTIPECPCSKNLISESRDTDIENGILDNMIFDETNTNPVIHQLSRLEDTCVLQDPKLVVENGAAHWMKVRRHQKKRTSLRSSARSRNSSLNTRRSGESGIHKRILKVNSAAKTNSLRLSTAASTFANVIDSSPPDLSGSRENHVDTLPMSPYQDRKMATQINYADTPKELKSTLSMLRQNIDSIHAKANILIIETDRCWREEGAEVMLEASDSNEWCLAVKVNDSIRYLHKPQEMKLCGTNRLTHAMIWTGENSWKLEFSNRIDWLMFKELHRECYSRNSHSQEVSMTNSKKMIPVPVVRIVPGYEEAHGIFVRPDLYMKTKHDELERALTSTTSYYDMDSEDDEWLECLNCNLPLGGSGGPVQVSNDDFEKVIFTLEKAAYNNPDEACDPEKAISYCSEYGSKDVLAAIFEYYCSKKDKHKRTALLRVFMEPSRRSVATQKPFLRKKRSFKRQGTHSGRGKPEIYLRVGALKEELRRIEEAKAAATAAMEVARKSRCRAQILMTNADLATYKASLALRLAEAIQDAAPPAVSSILD